jgi:molecular chaperone GrpE (heat shock protein)
VTTPPRDLARDLNWVLNAYIGDIEQLTHEAARRERAAWQNAEKQTRREVAEAIARDIEKTVEALGPAMRFAAAIARQHGARS